MIGRRSLFLIAVLAWAAVLHADYAEEFRQGILASERKDWKEVIRRMQAAIATRPNESRDRVFIYGIHYEPYLPHLWLGLGYSNLEQCDNALRELTESEKQTEVTKTTRYRDLQIASYQCQKKVPAKPAEVSATKIPDDAVNAAAAAAQEQIDGANRATQQFQQTANSDPSLADRFTQASGNLNAAKRRFDAGKLAKNPAEIIAAGDMASVARGELDLLLRDATRNAATADQERRRTASQQLQTEIVQRLGDARIAIVLAARETPNSQLSAAISSLRQQIDRARNASQISSADDLRQLSATLATETSRVQKLTASSTAAKPEWPPAPLFEAAASFFNGNYQRTLTVLGAAKFDDPASKAQALLFRSAAHYSLYALGGERDTALRTAALQEIRQCRLADARAVPTLGDFSPRFVQFFAGATQGTP